MSVLRNGYFKENEKLEKAIAKVKDQYKDNKEKQDEAFKEMQVPILVKQDKYKEDFETIKAEYLEKERLLEMS